MPPYRLILEDHRNVFPATLVNVEAAIRKLANSTGPTFLNLKDEGGNWAQAGGTDGRHRVEVRDIYGEGFQYWMDDEVAEKGLGIKVIKPKGDKGNRT